MGLLHPQWRKFRRIFKKEMWWQGELLAISCGYLLFLGNFLECPVFVGVCVCEVKVLDDSPVKLYLKMIKKVYS